MSLNLQTLTWQDIKQEVARVNSELADEIDQASGSKEMELYKVIYPYGAYIVDRGDFKIPTSDYRLLSLSDPEVPEKIREDLNYVDGDIPVALILKKTVSDFLLNQNRRIPTGIYEPGHIISLWTQFDKHAFLKTHPAKLVYLTAGASCLFMLPKISNAGQHKLLRRSYGIQKEVPKQMGDHWPVFSELYKNQTNQGKWNTELLLFPKYWIDRINTDKSWRSLHSLLLTKAWQGSAVERNQMFFDLALSTAIENRYLKPNPYIKDTARHIIMIAMGAICGFGTPNNEDAAPVKMIQKAYVESYGLSDYYPSIVVPKHFSPTTHEISAPVYYSFNYPTVTNYSPKSRKDTTTLDDLRQLKLILSVFFDHLLNDDLYTQNSILKHIAETVQVNYFHVTGDVNDGIMPAHTMPAYDPFLMSDQRQFPQNQEFAYNAGFLKGCIGLKQVHK